MVAVQTLEKYRWRLIFLFHEASAKDIRPIRKLSQTFAHSIEHMYTSVYLAALPFFLKSHKTLYIPEFISLFWLFPFTILG